MSRVLVFCTVVMLLMSACTNPNEPIVTYQISYKADDAESGSPPTDDNRYAEGERVVVRDNTSGLTKSDYQFGGWCCVKGSEADAYAAGSTLSMPAQDIVLTARWVHTNIAGMDHRETVPVPNSSFVQSESNVVQYEHAVSTFEIGNFEVSYELWYEVFFWATNNGYSFSAQYVGKTGDDDDQAANSPFITSTEHEPVTHVCWRDAVLWCNAYSEMAGLMPVYYTQYDGVIYSAPLKSVTNSTSISILGGSQDSLFVNWQANGYRLPTEGEWQLAAAYQDGSSWTAYNYASGAWTYYNDYYTDINGNGTWDGIEANGEVAVYDRDEVTQFYIVYTSIDHTQNVGLKAANQLSLYDMSGNVFEWCWDWYAEYPDTSQQDYRGPITILSGPDQRILRGGSWDMSAEYLQIGMRARDEPWTATSNTGFRVARTP